MEDVWVLAAWSFFFALCIGYIVVVGPVYRLEAMEAGTIPKYAGALKDAEFVPKIFFPAAFLFWFVLWSAKYTLLCMCKRLV